MSTKVILNILSFICIFTISYLIFIIPAHAQSSHEQAVENLNSATTPFKTVEVETEDKSLFDQFLTEVSDQFDKFARGLLGFVPNISNFPLFSTRAEVQHQAELPEAVKSSGDPLEETSGNLGQDESVGIYDSMLPEEAQDGQSTSCQTEKLYEQANFIKGVNPISLSGCTNP